MFCIDRFTIEYREYALGLDELHPRFSWSLDSDRKNVVQTFYRISVQSEKGEKVWDSGKTESRETLFIPCGGTLCPRTGYLAEIEVGDNYGNTARSELRFETGLYGEPLKGDFISRTMIPEEVCPIFRKNFSVNQTVKKVRIYATALGVYELFLNGKRVGNLYDAPYWTSYPNRLQYQTYDATELVKPGRENTLEVLVANGWYKGALGFTKTSGFYGDRTAICLDLILTDRDGSEEHIFTDKSWSAAPSALRASEFFDGEYFDSTFASKEELPVETLDYDKSKILAQISEPVRVTERIAAVRKIETPRGETVLDFGQNLTGILEFTYRGERGASVVVQHAEVLDREGNFYTENLRGAKCTDTFILDGSLQTLRPHFTFRGFRYVKLTGFDNVDLSAFTALVLHSDMRRTGYFHSSNESVNRLQQNIVWGQRGNFFDIPTDCPQRDERLGWTGDAQVFCRTASYQYETALFFKKWLGDLKAEQTTQFGVPHVIPNILGDQDGAACWSDCATIIPWTMYEVYGDLKILEDQYESMRGWIEYIRGKSPNFLWQSGYQYGDWLALDKEEGSDRTGATDKYLVATAFYAYSTELVRRAAEVLGKKEDEREYSELYRKIVSAFQKEYVTRTGRLVSETQTACVLALHFGLIEKRFRQRIVRILETNLNAHKNHLVTGFAGTPYLCHALSDNGLHELAATVFMNDDYPSWLYEVKMGATTIWERWNGIAPDGTLFDPGMNSFNHYAYGSIGDWLYRKVAGIDCLEPGYRKILIKPYLTKGLTSVKAEYHSISGLIAVDYFCINGIFQCTVKIPPNTEAKIMLPGRKRVKHLGSGEYEFQYELDQDLSMQRFTFESTVGKVLAEPRAVEMLEDAMPGFCSNPMMEFAKGMTINEVAAVGGEQVKALFDPILKELNKK